MSVSSYLVDRGTNMYGDRQEEYRQSVEKIVIKNSTTIKMALANSTDLKELFFSILEKLGKSRQALAQTHNIPDKELFGISRNLPLKFTTIATSLHPPYESYNAKLISLFQKHLKTMGFSKERWKQHELKISLDTAFAGTSIQREASLTISVIKPEQILFHITGKTRHEKSGEVTVNVEWRRDVIEKLSQVCDIPFAVLQGSLYFFLVNKEFMQKLRRDAPDDYQNVNLSLITHKVEVLDPDERKDEWIVATLRSQIGDKMYSFAKYLVWINRHQSDPIKSMEDHSVVNIIHQDSFLIDDTLNDVAHIFEKAVKWAPEEGVQTLKDRVALLHYELQHASPFLRGSGATAEWMEQIVYRVHGYTVTYNPKQSPPFEALTSCLSEFVKNYDKMLTLEKIEGAASVL